MCLPFLVQHVDTVYGNELTLCRAIRCIEQCAGPNTDLASASDNHITNIIHTVRFWALQVSKWT